MDDISKNQSIKVLELVNKLYDVSTRGEALELLASLQCDLNLLSSCVFYSYGIVSILQQEILSIYPYLNKDSIPEDKEKRVCNALLILRSLIAPNSRKMSHLDLYFFSFLNPFLESPKEFFGNIRKVSIGILINIVTCPQYQNDLLALIQCDVFHSCMNNIVNMTQPEVRSVFYLMKILFSVRNNVLMYFNMDKEKRFARSIILYLQKRRDDLTEDDQAMHYLCSLLQIVYHYNFDIKVIYRELPIDIKKNFNLR